MLGPQSRRNQQSFKSQERNMLLFNDLRYRNQGEKRMTKFRRIGAAAVLFSLLAGPAMARQAISSPAYGGQSIYCATREAGNPHSKYCDYIAWAKWRSVGGWDSRLDNACLSNPGYIPAECGFGQQPGY